jgi:hypothetical protein
MILNNYKDYEFVRFEPGAYPKKYNAILLNKTTNKLKKIPFGDQRYQQYKDQALGLYSHMDHLDESRRNRYKLRHARDILKPFSSGFFSNYFLW